MREFSGVYKPKPLALPAHHCAWPRPPASCRAGLCLNPCRGEAPRAQIRSPQNRSVSAQKVSEPRLRASLSLGHPRARWPGPARPCSAPVWSGGPEQPKHYQTSSHASTVPPADPPPTTQPIYVPLPEGPGCCSPQDTHSLINK